MCFVTTEGRDGGGKGVQAALLTKRIVALGGQVANFDFPQYERPSGYFVKEYLNERYGSLDQIGAKRASVLYAVDRFDAAHEIREALAAGKTIVSNRYVASNMAHQGGKFDDPQERLEFFRWLYDLEYGILGIPKPDLNVILYVSAQAGDRNVERKGARAYLAGKSKDIHERDPEHLRRAGNVYDDLARLFPQEFVCINCMDGDTLMSPEAVHELVWAAVKPVLRLP